MQMETIKRPLVPDCVSYMQLELLIQQQKQPLNKGTPLLNATVWGMRDHDYGSKINEKNTHLNLANWYMEQDLCLNIASSSMMATKNTHQ